MLWRRGLDKVGEQGVGIQWSAQPSIHPCILPSTHPSVHPSAHLPIHALISESTQCLINPPIQPASHSSTHPSSHESIQWLTDSSLYPSNPPIFPSLQRWLIKLHVKPWAGSFNSDMVWILMHIPVRDTGMDIIHCGPLCWVLQLTWFKKSATGMRQAAWRTGLQRRSLQGSHGMCKGSPPGARERHFGKRE